MAYDISNLDAKLQTYLDGNRAQLVSAAIFGVKSTDNMNIQTGVKCDTPIIRLENDVEFQNGEDCGFNASGATTFSDRILHPEFVKVNMSWCDKDFLRTWASHEVSVTAGRETMPFEEKITDNLVRKINVEVEKLIWQGDKTNGTGNLALMDGIHTLIENDITNTVIPASNVIAKGSDTIFTRIEKLWQAIPAEYTDRVTFFTSVTNYKQLIVELTNSNLYHIFEEYQGEYRMRLPFAGNVELVGLPALEGIDTIIATPYDNLYYGCDVENDSEIFDMWYSKDDRVFKFDCEFAVAVQYAIPEAVFVNE